MVLGHFRSFWIFLGHFSSFLRWFQLVLDGFRSFQIILDRFSSFVTLVSTLKQVFSAQKLPTWLICTMLYIQGKIKTAILRLKLSKTKLKTDQFSLISACFFTANLRKKDKNHVWTRHKSIICSIFSRRTNVSFLSALSSSFIYYVWQKFFLVFVANYPISWQLLMDIIFGYPLIGQFDTI